MRSLPILLLCALVTCLPRLSYAAILPPERADAMFHSYSGGGVTISGPSVLVRKNFLEKVSVSANYYVDSITSASVDVEARASQYNEERTEYKLGVEYLTNKTLFSVGLTSSEENDFSAKNYSFSVSQDFFGDMSTLSLGYSRGDDVVKQTGNPGFAENVDRHNFRLGLTQVLTKKLIANFIVDFITDEGYLNNPYRAARYLDSDAATGFSYQTEIYPETRTSTAFSVRTAYFLPYRAALHNEYRFFTDTWKINAHNFETKYVHPLEGKHWFFDNVLLEVKFRYYTQTAAEFYADLFPYENAQNFLARDKEMSQFQTFVLGFGAELGFNAGFDFIKQSSLNLFWDFHSYSYDNFRNVNASQPGNLLTPGTEPLYQYNANVIQAFVSFWF